MEHAIKYFAEYEFKNKSSKYWFPLLINSISTIEAEAVYNSIHGNLAREFDDIKQFKIKPFNNYTYSQALRPFSKSKKSAQVAALKLDELKIEVIDGPDDLIIKDIIKIQPQHLLNYYKHSIQQYLDDQSFLTTQYHNNQDISKEYLILQLHS